LLTDHFPARSLLTLGTIPLRYACGTERGHWPRSCRLSCAVGQPIVVIGTAIHVCRCRRIMRDFQRNQRYLHRLRRPWPQWGSCSEWEPHQSVPESTVRLECSRRWHLGATERSHPVRSGHSNDAYSLNTHAALTGDPGGIDVQMTRVSVLSAHLRISRP